MPSARFPPPRGHGGRRGYKHGRAGQCLRPRGGVLPGPKNASAAPIAAAPPKRAAARSIMACRSWGLVLPTSRGSDAPGPARKRGSGDLLMWC